MPNGRPRVEPPTDQIACVQGDANQVGGDETELCRTDSDDANDRAIESRDHPTLPELLAQ